jgi:hypothetical protein
MDFDKLTCSSCSIEWNRQKTRGRKPKVCPDCTIKPIDEVEEEDPTEDIPLSPEPRRAKTKYPPNTKWLCHSCQATVKIGIGINEEPTHKCQKRLKKVFPLERV